jgi:hypothetical protein
MTGTGGERAGYSPAQYVDAFEQVFHEPVDHINFGAMNLASEKTRLLELSGLIQTYFEEVRYPEGERDEFVPAMEPKQATSAFGFGHPMFDYTPPLWKDQIRKYLLFAHRVCFEDPIYQIIDPVATCIGERSYMDGGVLFQPSVTHPEQLELLRTCLLNVQAMAPLIRAGIAIPHQFRTDRLPGFREGEYSSNWFPDENSYFLMERISQLLGETMSVGALDRTGLPSELVQAAKEYAERQGGWQNVGWHAEFFDEFGAFNPHLEKLRAYDELPDTIFHFASFGRYLETNNLNYQLHYNEPWKYKLLESLEVVDFASELVGGDHGSGAANLGPRDLASAVAINRIESKILPNLDALSDRDLVAMRQNEELFAQWRDLIRLPLQRADQLAASDARVSRHLREELSDVYAGWRAQSKREVRQSLGGFVSEIGEGATVGIVAGAALGEPFSAASLALGAAYNVLKGGGRAFSWRQDRQLVARHFLAVT